MSRKARTSRATSQPKSGDLFRHEATSDKNCSADLSYSDSVSESDSQKRAKRVGLRGGRYTKHTLLAKLNARIKRAGPNDCWPVEGCKANKVGHVALSIGSPWKPPYIRINAHVFAWQHANGRPIPKGQVVMHSCDNPRCCNPAHLNLGTQADNVHDAIHKGRFNAFGRQKLNAEKVLEIRRRAAAHETHASIAARFGVARHTVTGILNGNSWNHLGDRPFDPRPVSVEQVADESFQRVPSVQLEIRGEVG